MGEPVVSGFEVKASASWLLSLLVRVRNRPSPKVKANITTFARQSEQDEANMGESCMFSQCFYPYANLMWIHKSVVKKWERRSYLVPDENCECQCEHVGSTVIFKKCSDGGKVYVQPLNIHQ